MDKAQQLYNKENASKEIKKEIHPYSLWCFIFSISPLGGLFFYIIPIINLIYFIFIIPMLITSIILGIISFGKIEKNKNKYWGNGFSIAGIIISTLSLIGFLLILYFFYNLLSTYT